MKHKLHTIWWARNLLRFSSNSASIHSAKIRIHSLVAMSGNVSNGKCLPSDFSFLDSFPVSYHCRRVKDISIVLWKPSTAPWLKVNTDGSIIGGYAACGGLFKDHLGMFLGAFHAEILGFIYDIEYVAHNGWRNNWLESDSSSVLMIFSNASLVPVLFHYKWHNARSFGVQVVSFFPRR